ncbi:MAG: hypothetical protein COA78_07650 [Blastopirellula sp.]|nr:MAG: hypothetical protein COA78_07650 [Blastopirellula sp.]
MLWYVHLTDRPCLNKHIQNVKDRNSILPEKYQVKWLPKIRFSMRTLFVLVTLLCVLLVPLSAKLYQARQQKLAVEWVLANGGILTYVYKSDEYGNYSRTKEPTDKQWLRSILGNDFFDSIEFVKLKGTVKDGLSPLAHIKQLKILYLTNIEETDLSTLPQLQDVETIRLSGKVHTDISPLIKHPKLAELYLAESTSVTDISPLSQLSSLKRLHLNESQIPSAVSLTNLESLESISVSVKTRENLLNIKKLTCPLNLIVYEKSINDLTPLAEVSSIITLQINWTHLDELPSFAHMKDLSDLKILSSQEITKIPPLPNTPSLNEFILTYSKVEDLQPLINQTELKSLYLIENQISDLSVLANFTELTYLDLTEPNVTDISPLAKLEQLEELRMIASKVTDLKPLLNLKGIKKLALTSSKGTDFSPLYQLSTLKHLSFCDMTISKEELNKLQMALPNCKILASNTNGFERSYHFRF